MKVKVILLILCYFKKQQINANILSLYWGTNIIIDLALKEHSGDITYFRGKCFNNQISCRNINSQHLSFFLNISILKFYLKPVTRTTRHGWFLKKKNYFGINDNGKHLLLLTPSNTEFWLWEGWQRTVHSLETKAPIKVWFKSMCCSFLFSLYSYMYKHNDIAVFIIHFNVYMPCPCVILMYKYNWQECKWEN